MTDKFLGTTGNGFRLNPSGLMGGARNGNYRSLEELKSLSQGKSSNDPEVIKSVAKEIESLFVHEMIKVMRETGETTSNKDFGNSIHMGMFDTEMARFIAERGIGLQDMLVKELSKRAQKTDGGESEVQLAKSAGQESVDLNSDISKPEFTNIPTQDQKTKETGSETQNRKLNNQPSRIFPHLQILLDEPEETQVVSPESKIGNHELRKEALPTFQAPNFGDADQKADGTEAVVEDKTKLSENQNLSPNPFTNFLNPNVGNGIEEEKGEETGTQESEPSIWKTSNPYLALNHFPDLTVKDAKELRKDKEVVKAGSKEPGNPYLALNRFPDLLVRNNPEDAGRTKKIESAGIQEPKDTGFEPYNPALSIPDFPEIQKFDETDKSNLEDKPVSQKPDTLTSYTYNNFLDTEPRLLPINGRISSHFGMRSHPVYGDMRFHHGIDIAAPAGTEIHPIERGKVVFSGEQSGYGNVVIIDHGNGFTSKYAHNKVNLVKEGDEIDTNTAIGLVGSTGMSTGPHLHFEVRYKGSSINPVEFAKEFEKISDNISKSI